MGDSAEEKKRRRNARRRQQYAGDPEVREKSKARSRAFKCKNKDAINAERRLRYGTDPEYQASRLAHGSKTQRKSDLKRRYGLSLEGYSAMLSRQNGVCVICLKEDVNKPLSVDHDHKTRMLRDLLCGGCNNGLGNYRDDGAPTISSIGNGATQTLATLALRRLHSPPQIASSLQLTKRSSTWK
jgi:hypothetical protein